MATRPRSDGTADRDQAICAHLPLVRQVAQRFHVGPSSPVDMGDLIQFGVLGLIDATEKFDETKGASFQSYARYRIKGSILDGLRRLDFLPRSVRRKRREILEATQRVEQEQHSAARDEDIAAAMDMDTDELREVMDKIQGASISSFEEIQEKGGEAEVVAARGDAEERTSPEKALERVELRGLLSAAVEELPEKEKTVLALYYYEELTMREVGEILGVTESRVSQLHSKALGRLRTRVARDLAAPAA